MGDGNVVEKTVDVRLRTGIGDVSMIRERFDAPMDMVGRAKDSHHLQLSLLPFPKASSACFEDVWGPHRYERMGHLFLLPAQSLLRTRTVSHVQHSLVCELQPRAIRGWFDSEFEWTDDHLTESLDIVSGDARRLMKAVIAELQSPGFAKETMIELLIGQICVTLTRHFSAIAGERPAGGLAPWRMRLIDDYLVAHPRTVNIADLARLCGLSARHLSRAFHASVGRSLGDHIAQHRVDLAKRMLATGASVKQTAFASGFSAPTNFATAFRRATGSSPRQYRDRSLR